MGGRTHQCDLGHIQEGSSGVAASSSYSYSFLDSLFTIVIYLFSSSVTETFGCIIVWKQSVIYSCFVYDACLLSLCRTDQLFAIRKECTECMTSTFTLKNSEIIVIASVIACGHNAKFIAYICTNLRITSHTHNTFAQHFRT